jgi:hypothetical protein
VLTSCEQDSIARPLPASHSTLHCSALYPGRLKTHCRLQHVKAASLTSLLPSRRFIRNSSGRFFVGRPRHREHSYCKLPLDVTQPLAFCIFRKRTGASPQNAKSRVFPTFHAPPAPPALGLELLTGRELKVERAVRLAETVAECLRVARTAAWRKCHLQPVMVTQSAPPCSLVALLFVRQAGVMPGIPAGSQNAVALNSLAGHCTCTFASWAAKVRCSGEQRVVSSHQYI